MKRFPSGPGLVLFLATACLPATAAIYDITVNSTIGTSNVVQHRMYVPDGLTVVRGILLYGNGANGDDRAKANRAHYQAFADNVGFAIIATSKMDRYMRSAAEIGSNFNSWAPPGGGGDGRRLTEGMEQLAALSGHPEILNAPVIFWGFSGAGQMAYEYNAWKPERTIAYSVNKGGFYTTEVCSVEARKTPGIMISDQNDTNTSRRAHIQEVYADNKGPGASWAYMMEQNTVHEEGAADHMLLRFFHNMIRLRYPADQNPVTGPVTLKEVPFDSGWLADQTTWQTPNGMTAIATVGGYAGDPVNPSWLPDKDTAFLFRALSSWNRPLSINTSSQAYAAGAPVTITVNTGAFPDWTKLEFYNGATKLGEVIAGSPAQLTLNSLPPAVYGFVVIGYKADGTIRTSNPRTVVMRGGPGGPEPIDVWKHTIFGDQAGDARVSGDEADPDNDGANNLAEFQAGTNPLETPPPPPPPDPYPVFHHSISPSQGTFDGTAVLPGQVIGIQAGVRGRLSFVNLHGTAELPIIIVNQGGLVSLSSGASDEAIRFANSEHFKLLGDGDPTLKYGIEVTKATGTCVQITDKSTDFEVAFLHLHHAGYAGIMSKTDPRTDLSYNRGGFTQRNVSFHDNYIHDVGGEGFYLGSSFYIGTTAGSTTVFPHDIIGMRVYNNRTERTGREGIQLGCVIEDCEVHDNVVINSGTLDMADQNSGVQIGPGTTGKFYNNVIIGAPQNGLSLIGLGNNAVFNNVIANTGAHSIFTDNRNRTSDPSIGTIPGSFIHILNNTFINAGQFGVRTQNELSPHEFRNNLAVGMTSGLLDAGASITIASSNNLAQATAAGLGFVNAGANDYRLVGTSAARDAGADLTSLGVTLDAQGLARPFGPAFDVGAHEAGALSLVLTSTNPTVTGAVDGTATTSVVGGTAPYAYLWNGGATGAARTGLAPGFHSVTVTDASGATRFGEVYLFDPAPIVPIIVQARVLPELADANDGRITLTLSGGAPPFTTAWSNGATGSTVTGLTAGFYSYTVTDAVGTTATATHYVRDAGTPIFRVNAGGNAEPDRVLNWSQDKEGALASPYLASTASLTTGSSTWSNTNNFTDAPANLMGNRRYINTSANQLRYAFPVQPGYYEINLYFNEVMTTYVVGSRVFDVSVEGELVLNDLDMVAAHGIDRPAQYTYVRNVTDGTINLTIDRGAGSAMISGIAIHRLSGPASQMASVQITGATTTYDGTAKALTATTFPANLAVGLTYNGSATEPINAGTYDVIATITEAGYSGSASATLVINRAPAMVTLGSGGSQPVKLAYDGTPGSPSFTTSPGGLSVVTTYDGSTTPPTFPGTYHVITTVSDLNYTGTTEGTLVIRTTALVRHAPTVAGMLDGSVQLVSGENVTLNGTATVTSDLLVPGTPTVAVGSSALLAGTVEGPGDVSPSGYSVALGGNALLRYLVRRIDGVALPVVAVPPLPTGTRNVALTNAAQSPGDFTTLRNLTLSGNAGLVAVPPGTYGSFVAYGNSGFVLGVPGATEPAVYNLQGLGLNVLPGTAQLQVVGPVIINLPVGILLNGAAGSALHPDWLTLRLATGGLTINGSYQCHGHVIASNGTVTLNASATLNGTVVSDRLNLNGTSVLHDPGL